MTQCPTREEIERILTDEVGDPDGNAIAAHVQECPSCQAVMAQVSAASATTDEWVATTPAEPVLSEDDQDLLRKLRDAPAPRSDQASAVPADECGPIQTTLPEIPGYVDLAEIGRGGMGVVYKARQLNLNRTVALKMLLGGQLASPADVNRLRTEAAAAAGLQHPNIVAVHEVAEHAGRHYIVMEYVEGTSLSALVSPTPLPPQRAARYIKTVAEAIHHAHERGILHRDLKPSNVLIDVADQPRVTDFGLAKRVDVPSDLTATGQILGTPGYMPPEQASGKRGELGRPSDVYSIGATLYELLTARPPFRAATTFDTLMQTIQVEPVSPLALNRQVDRDLETITLKCLAKEQRQRYETAAEVAADLRRWLAGEPILARPVGPAARLWRWSRRNPIVAALSAFTLTLAIAVASVATVAYVREASRTELALSQLAQTYLERGQEGAKAGEVGPGLLYMARALETVPKHNKELEGAIRQNLAVWSGSYSPVELVLSHPAAASSVAFGPDGNTVVTGCGDGKARLWNLATATPLFEIPCDSRGGVAVAFSCDGDRVATGDASGARIWDASNGQPIGVPLEHPASVRAVAFSPDGELLLTGGGDGGVRLWNSSNQARVIGTHEATVYSVEFHRSGKFAITASHDRTAKIWNVQTGECVNTLGHMTIALRAAFWSDNRVVTTAWGSAQLWASPEEHPITSAPEPRPIAPMFPHDGTLWGLAISPDRSRIVTGGDDKFVRVWDSQTAKQIASFRHGDSIRALAISPDGTTVASAGDDGAVRFWRIPGIGPPGVRRLDHGHQIGSACFSADGRFILTASHDNTAGLWDAETGQLVRSFSHVNVRRACFGPDTRTIVTADVTGTVRLWDVTTGLSKREFKHDSEVPSPAFRPRTSQFATAGHDALVRIWDAVSGSLLRTMKHDDAVLGVSFSPDGRFLASWSGDRSARIWDPDDGKLVVTVRHNGPVPTSAWSSDSSMLATGGYDNVARVWSIPSGNPLTSSLEHHGKPGAVGFVEFSRDGRLLLTTSTDKTARLWSIPSGKLVRVFLHAGPVGIPAFHPSGRLVVTGESSGADGQCQIWDAPTGLRVGPPVALNWSANATFSPDGSKVLFYYAQAGTALLAKVPAPVDCAPAIVTLWVQALTGTEIDVDGAIRPLDSKAIANRRHRVEDLSSGRLRVPEQVAMPNSPEEWLAWYQLRAKERQDAGYWHAAVYYLGKIRELEPNNGTTRHRRARMLTILRRFREAVADWDYAIVLTEGHDQLAMRVHRALALAGAGDHASAAAQAEELARAQDVSTTTLYNCACIFSLAAGAAGMDEKLSDTERERLENQYRDHALELLDQAWHAGFFNNPDNLDHMKNDPDLGPIRRHSGFKKLFERLTAGERRENR